MQSNFAAAILIEKIVRETYTKRSSTAIQPLQWSILRYLQRTPDAQCTMSMLASFLGLTHGPVVRAISTLVKRGLVEQIANLQDARSKTLKLTPAGHDALESDPILGIASRIDNLPEDDQQIFVKLVRSLAMYPTPEDVSDNEVNPAN
ncbi:MarR family winged helix-turn-helix transcriptional regulator [Loktanella sp. S4079]|uniref:MarR family winged helix-turn-helix transcriptional regulator n=1 Tax=Loktanella sp. S4079 TaxID=579483 RepID=UPI0006989236|nr:MarR family winged helix-turn-helix transcriptional regulator [Loktanella sp. S4079]